MFMSREFGLLTVAEQSVSLILPFRVRRRTQNITVDVESVRQPWEEDEIVSPNRKPVAIHFDQQVRR